MPSSHTNLSHIHWNSAERGARRSLRLYATLVVAAALGAACGSSDTVGKPGKDGGSSDGGGGASGTSGAGGAGDSGASGSGASGSGGDSGSAGSAGAGGGTVVACSGAAVDIGGITKVEVGKWRDNATAAYTATHDDECDSSVTGIDQNAVPLMQKYGMFGLVSAITSTCDEVGDSAYATMKADQQKGVDIGSHSKTHPEITSANMVDEIGGSKQVLDSKLSKPVVSFVFPYDYFDVSTFPELKSAGYVAARGGTRDPFDGFTNPPINPADPPADVTTDGSGDLRLAFDDWPRTYSKYALYYEKDILTIHVWNAVDRGGYAVREFHSVTDATGSDAGFGPIKIADYEAHLTWLKNMWKANKTWTAPLGDVVKYRTARTKATATASGNTITPLYSGDAAHLTPVSFIITTGSDVASVSATQGGNPVSARKIAASQYSVTADPQGGAITVNGCADADPNAVDPNADVGTKPTPAKSVCDIVTIVAKGGAGRMDDLERTQENFQTLPNLCQQDGRDGQWSWYPQGVTVGMVCEAGTDPLGLCEPTTSCSGQNTVLHAKYTTAAGEWAGVTLGFTGGNGAGACYDASAYQGVRFKIKGTFTGGNDNNGRGVNVSFVTAETQSQAFGGDQDPNTVCGHYHYVIPSLSSSWATIPIPWSGLQPGYNNANCANRPFAVKKLQAIDFGTGDGGGFDISLDDIELY